MSMVHMLQKVELTVQLAWTLNVGRTLLQASEKLLLLDILWASSHAACSIHSSSPSTVHSPCTLWDVPDVAVMVWYSHDLVPKHPRANRVKKTQRKCVGNLVLGHCRTNNQKNYNAKSTRKHELDVRKLWRVSGPNRNSPNGKTAIMQSPCSSSRWGKTPFTGPCSVELGSSSCVRPSR